MLSEERETDIPTGPTRQQDTGRQAETMLMLLRDEAAVW
jgi:hypothetical protein